MANKKKVNKNKTVNKSKKEITSTKDKVKEIDEQDEIKNFIIIILSLTLIIILVFVFTKYVINDGDIRIPERDTLAGAYNDQVVTGGTMFNRIEDEYYVAVYDNTTSDSLIVSSQIATYLRSEDALKVYNLDLNNKLNEEFIATEEKPENTDAKTVDELSFGEMTLVKIKDGKIVNYYTGLEKITEVLEVEED